VGELDIAGVGRLTACVDDMTTMWPNPTAVRVDLSRLSFVDVVGLRALAHACQRLEVVADSFELSGINQTVERAMLVANIHLPGTRVRVRHVTG
jgi:anti-anti-sigma factor